MNYCGSNIPHLVSNPLVISLSKFGYIGSHVVCQQSILRPFKDCLELPELVLFSSLPHLPTSSFAVFPSPSPSPIPLFPLYYSTSLSIPFALAFPLPFISLFPTLLFFPFPWIAISVSQKAMALDPVYIYQYVLSLRLKISAKWRRMNALTNSNTHFFFLWIILQNKVFKHLLNFVSKSFPHPDEVYKWDFSQGAKYN